MDGTIAIALVTKLIMEFERARPGFIDRLAEGFEVPEGVVPLERPEERLLREGCLSTLNAIPRGRKN